jgi:hypothetical protein
MPGTHLLLHVAPRLLPACLDNRLVRPTMIQNAGAIPTAIAKDWLFFVVWNLKN